MSAISALLIGIMLVLIFIWYRSPSTERQLKRFERELELIIRRRRPQRAQRFLTDIFGFLQHNISASNTSACYKAVDLLKAAYGEGISRPDEMAHLVSLSVMAMREKQYDIASFLTDVLRQVIKRQQSDQVIKTLEQLQLLALVSLKNKQNYIAAKAIDLMFYIIEKPEWQKNHSSTVPRAIAAISAAGIQVIRRRDNAMLREIFANLEGWYDQAVPSADMEIAKLVVAWLHRALHSDEKAAVDQVCDFITKMNQRRTLETGARELLTSEMKNLAGAMSLDPGSWVPAVLLLLILELGLSHENSKAGQQAVRTAGDIARMAIHNHELVVSFAAIKPLLDQGRKMLVLELKLGGEASDGGYRQQMLFFIVKECLAVIEYAARKRMIDSVSDVVDDLIKIWENGAETIYTAKSFKKFCGLLLLYHTASRRNRHVPPELYSANMALFTNKEQDKLRAFIGGI